MRKKRKCRVSRAGKGPVLNKRPKAASSNIIPKEQQKRHNHTETRYGALERVVTVQGRLFQQGDMTIEQKTACDIYEERYCAVNGRSFGGKSCLDFSFGGGGKPETEKQVQRAIGFKELLSKIGMARLILDKYVVNKTIDDDSVIAHEYTPIKTRLKKGVARYQPVKSTDGVIQTQVVKQPIKLCLPEKDMAALLSASQRLVNVLKINHQSY